MANEVATKFGEGIRVNAIAPGFFLTEQNRTLLTNEDGTYTQRGNDVISRLRSNVSVKQRNCVEPSSISSAMPAAL